MSVDAEKENAVLQKKIEDAKKFIKELTKKRTQIRKKIGVNKNTVQSLKEEVVELEDELNGLEGQLDSMVEYDVKKYFPSIKIKNNSVQITDKEMRRILRDVDKGIKGDIEDAMYEAYGGNGNGKRTKKKVAKKRVGKPRVAKTKDIRSVITILDNRMKVTKKKKATKKKVAVPRRKRRRPLLGK